MAERFLAVKRGRPKESEKLKRTSITFHSETADRFRHFISENEIDGFDEGLNLLMNEVDKLHKYHLSCEVK